MAFHCMNCNGSMVFDVGLQKMRCLHCDSTCDPEDFAVSDEGIASADDSIARFVCRNCGAALTGTEDSLVGFCPYCGGQAMVREEGGTVSPERLIPFRVEKQKCLEAYGTYTKKVPYLPKELRDPEFIERFLGIYMPFWQYDISFGSSSATGVKRYVEGAYDVVERHRYDVVVTETYDALTFDGSRYLDDKLSERVQPYHTTEERPFTPAYLAGFYADASTLGSEVYGEEACATASEDLIDAASKTVNKLYDTTLDGDISGVNAHIESVHPVLFPMWFLTWRKDDRVAYAVVNGESGKVVADLPLDLRTFAIACAVLAAVLFIVLELLVQPTPQVTGIVCLVCALIMGFALKRAVRQEYEHRRSVEDPGWDVRETSKKATKRRRKRQTVINENIITWIVVPILVMLSIIISLARNTPMTMNLPALLAKVVPVIALVSVASVGMRVVPWGWRAERKTSLIAYAVLCLTVIPCALIVLSDPINDGWYYLGDAACILGLLLASAMTIAAYNLSTMRPLPKLFDREEVQ